jgi:subtilisin family serine protease
MMAAEKKSGARSSSTRARAAKKSAAKKSAAKKSAASGASTAADGDDETPPVVTDSAGRRSLLVELRTDAGMSASFAPSGLRASAAEAAFDLDEEFEPVTMSGASAGLGFAAAPSSYVVRIKVDDVEDAKESIKQRPDVVDVWDDTPIAPFQCPIPPCDCQPTVPKGTIADVANYLEVSQMWSSGYRGAGIVVGVVDGGITAQGRPVAAGETSRRIPRVIGGWPVADWGTKASAWGDHGNMCSTDVLGMAPEAQLFDLRISGSGGSTATISRALQAFQWAIDRHKTDGTPHVLSNSWGIFQESWDTTYARNPNHPFTRKVVEAIDEGIIVLFAAGNCGGTCPDGRCGSDNGPGKSIWGANSHPRVMTVGAVNKDEQFVGYSSQGPGALDPNKPDFCSVTHFTGYFNSDSGTSAATPILAGAVALLKQARPWASHDAIKSALKATAKDIGPAGFDQHSGAGIVRPRAALGRLTRVTLVTRTAVCRPSVIRCQLPSRQIVCRPSVTTPCLPVTRTPTCTVNTRTVTCQVTRLACPVPTAPPQCDIVNTRVCPSIACIPEPGFEAGEWASAEVDPAWQDWYGYDSDVIDDEEQWYG